MSSAETPSGRPCRWRLSSTTGRLQFLRDELRRVLRAAGLGESDLHDLVLATHEAAVNGMVHGNKLDAAKRVTVEIAFLDEEVVVQVSDEGEGFTWAPVLRRAQAGEVSPNALHGRGIMVMAAVMDEITYCAPGNAVRMVKRLRTGHRSGQAGGGHLA